ncbi:LicD family protein [Anaerofustis stercorihominis]|uniref:LicD/FKTN/FKRP nucleotidyltransferase domain-containing protein n=1 Tax=Anaerofustis stercorihominis TaxID=214853 RepID=A0A3E3DZQ2_9FIRM|nr:LicD family protein [Anaerofustis stercorihominis]RGD74168.1 hypothetical protein DW687_05215 [Anaerofustis stercorihominis]
MTETQQNLYKLLIELDKICNDNDIQYFLAGGTSLGAIRHGGFLPWDDDVDLYITRKNYEKLDKVLNKMDIPNRSWITAENCETYCNPLPRYIDEDTTVIYRARIGDGTPHGQQIEFFILDPFPNDEEKQIEYKKYLWLYCEIMNPYFVSIRSTLPVETIDESLYNYYNKKIKKVGKNQVLFEIKEKITYDEDECDYYCARWGKRAIVYRKAWCDDVKLVQFEDRLFPVAKDVINCLSVDYGMNWNLIPNVDNQIIHSSIDRLDKSCWDNDEEIRKIVKKYNINDILYKNKQNNLFKGFRKIDFHRLESKLKNSYLQLLVNQWNKEKWRFSIEKTDELVKIFEPFFVFQLSFIYSKFNLSLDINEDLLETMVLSLIYSNRIKDCNIILNSNKKFSKEKDYSDICKAIYNLKIEKYNKNLNRVNVLLKYLINKNYSNQIEVLRTRAWLLSSEPTKSKNDDINSFKEFLSISNNDLEVFKYYADTLYYYGKKEEANKMYKDILNESNNGMIMLDIKNKLSKKRGGLDEKNN